MEPDSQVKLLRVLESHAFFRVGGTRRRTVDMRLVAATNRDLAEAIKTNQFRQDLYYRINTITVSLPPLRERREDIGLLARHFLEQNAAYGHKTLSPAALLSLERYDWPGNVRELQHAIQRAVILSTGEEIEPDDLPAEMRGDSSVPPPAGSLEEMERQHIVATLNQVGGPPRQGGGLARDRSQDPLPEDPELRDLAGSAQGLIAAAGRTGSGARWPAIGCIARCGY